MLQPSFVVIGPPVPEKKNFKGFLPYMGIAAILVMSPGLFIYTLVPTQQAPDVNLTSDIVFWSRRHTTNNQRPPDVSGRIYYDVKLTSDSTSV